MLNYDRRVLEKRNKNPFISQTELVYTLVLEDIMSNTRLLGSKLNKDQLAKAMGVSRSPVQAAINQLLSEGYLIKRGKSGYYVYIPTMRDVICASEFRIAVETNAATLALKRLTADDIKALQRNVEAQERCDRRDIAKMFDLDIEFHDRLVASSKSEYIINAYRQYEGKFRQVHNRITVANMQGIIFFQHKSILSAIIDRDSAQLESVLRTHLNHTEDYIQAPEYYYR